MCIKNKPKMELYVLNPKNYHGNIITTVEVTADLHGCYIKDRTTGKFYTALRSRFISDEQLFNDFKNCIK